MLVRSGFPELASVKYPPQALYSTYGIGISCMLLWTCRSLNLDGKGVAGHAVTWVSRNSLDIYYWHIFVVGLIQYGLVSIHGWLMKFAFVLLASILLTHVYLGATDKIRFWIRRTKQKK